MLPWTLHARSVLKGLHGCLLLSRQRGDLGYSVYLHGKWCRRERPRSPERRTRVPFKQNNEEDLMETAACLNCLMEKLNLTLRLVVTLWFPRTTEGCGMSTYTRIASTLFLWRKYCFPPTDVPAVNKARQTQHVSNSSEAASMQLSTGGKDCFSNQGHLSYLTPSISNCSFGATEHNTCDTLGPSLNQFYCAGVLGVVNCETE